MRIYKMTATFGKLEHETLTLEPGLNVMEAPNEWGKTTWCAFLAAMVYGLDTRAKSTKTTLADKERYMPWSGSPMAGRIDLNWNGRDITIERSTRGRVPMGEFRAYETKTGLEIPELTAANCGATILGVEQSVFRRSAFIRHADMPVTEDEALRRRLNDLVTTGDETGEADHLEKELREVKNRCRYNRTGLIPQAEEHRKELEEKIREWEALENHSHKLKLRLGEVKSWLRELENHRDTLHYAAAEADAARVAEAQDARDQAESAMLSAEEACRKLPSQEEAEKKVRAMREFCEDWNNVQMEQSLASQMPQQPEMPELFRGKTVKQAEAMVEEDSKRYAMLTCGDTNLVFLAIGVLFLGCGVLTAFLGEYMAAAFCLVAGLLSLIPGVVKKRKRQKNAEKLAQKYGTKDTNLWLEPLKRYQAEMEDYQRAMAEYRAARGDLDIHMTFLQRQRQSLCGGQRPEKVLELWQQVLRQWEKYSTACRELQQAEKHLQTLQDMAKPVRTPMMPDTLAYSEAETERLIGEAVAEQQRLQNRLGQYQGRMEALGGADTLRTQLQQTLHRLEKLEQTYAAAALALDTLEQARRELQRRFAPRIAKRAQQLLSGMTAGRYNRLTLDADLSLLAGAQQEDTLREALWRSDGTVDQLYIALRLAVAEELMPDIPLILDDAFVRFDDTRLQAALEILKQQAENKQVILFTCQNREKAYLNH